MSDLKDLQKWFASIITRPINIKSKMMTTSPSGLPMEEEAKKYIVPSPTLEAHERIEIYNQQYWWRLLSNLHDMFPLVTRLFGYTDFNQKIGFPYLLKYPPDSWSLNSLGDHLPKWIAEEYHEPDRELILSAAKIDLTCEKGFVAKEYPPFTVESPEILLEIPLKLQDHVQLFQLESQLPAFREEMLKEEPDFWEEHDFPKLERESPYFFVFFRNIDHDIVWEQIEEGEYFLLSLFSKGSTIATACDTLEKESPHLLESTSLHLTNWIQKWVSRGWLFSPRFIR